MRGSVSQVPKHQQIEVVGVLSLQDYSYYSYLFICNYHSHNYCIINHNIIIIYNYSIVIITRQSMEVFGAKSLGVRQILN